jgi:tetrahydromethanopterin S-methyltransferase subunit B
VLNHPIEGYRLPSETPSTAVVESPHKLRVLVANERDERLDKLTTLVEGLGHEISPARSKSKRYPSPTEPGQWGDAWR